MKLPHDATGYRMKNAYENPPIDALIRITKESGYSGLNDAVEIVDAEYISFPWSEKHSRQNFKDGVAKHRNNVTIYKTKRIPHKISEFDSREYDWITVEYRKKRENPKYGCGGQRNPNIQKYNWRRLSNLGKKIHSLDSRCPLDEKELRRYLELDLQSLADGGFFADDEEWNSLYKNEEMSDVDKDLSKSIDDLEREWDEQNFVGNDG